MNYKDWINQKYIAYLQQHGEHRTISEFAEFVGVHKSTMSAWMNGTRFPSHQKTIERLAARFGPEVYQVVGKQSTQTGYKPLSEAPSWIRERYAAATSEANQRFRKIAEEEEREPTAEEAAQIFREVFAKYGIFESENDAV